MNLLDQRWKMGLIKIGLAILIYVIYIFDILKLGYSGGELYLLVPLIVSHALLGFAILDFQKLRSRPRYLVVSYIILFLLVWINLSSFIEGVLPTHTIPGNIFIFVCATPIVIYILAKKSAKEKPEKKPIELKYLRFLLSFPIILTVIYIPITVSVFTSNEGEPFILLWWFGLNILWFSLIIFAWVVYKTYLLISKKKLISKEDG